MFGDTRISLQRSVGQVEESHCAKASSIHAAVSIEHRLVTDRQTDTDTTMAKAALA